MEATTYTVLVTVVHGDKGHSASRIGEMIHQALEEGTTDYPGFYAAQVDAFKGLVISDMRVLTGGKGSRGELDRLRRILPLHKEMNANTSAA